MKIEHCTSLEMITGTGVGTRDTLDSIKNAQGGSL